MQAKNSLSVVLVTTEIVPFSKVGGLADVMGALPRELEKLGVQTAIFTPLYASIDRSSFCIKPEPNVSALSVQVAGRKEPFRVFSCIKPETEVKTYFIENERFYGREGIYTVPESGKAFADEDERTIFLNRAVIAAMKAIGLGPDVVHCNDFHTGLIPAYLAIEESTHPMLSRAATVFSIHNLAYQGIFPREFLSKAGLSQTLFAPMSAFEFWGRVNVMKIAICYSGIISTVSETYAREITESEEYGYGLEGVLRERSSDIVGIPNGIDTEAWNPATDSLIPCRFTPQRLDGKRKCRTELLKAFGLPATSKGPVVGMVSRLVDQKGFDILAESFEGIMNLGVRLVILGTGQEKYHELFWNLAKKYRKQFGLRLEFNERVAHLIEAGSDFFLMPSRYEPCGLNQLYSLRYGTIPIVRSTGGLRDTIFQISEGGRTGNGFVFEQYSSRALLEAVRRAVAFFADKTAMNAVRKRIMVEDHSWRKSAERYVAMYERARSLAGMGLTR